MEISYRRMSNISVDIVGICWVSSFNFFLCKSALRYYVQGYGKPCALECYLRYRGIIGILIRAGGEPIGSPERVPTLF
jgi:hypothetical protein